MRRPPDDLMTLIVENRDSKEKMLLLHGIQLQEGEAKKLRQFIIEHQLKILTVNSCGPIDKIITVLENNSSLESVFLNIFNYDVWTRMGPYNIGDFFDRLSKELIRNSTLKHLYTHSV